MKRFIHSVLEIIAYGIIACGAIGLAALFIAGAQAVLHAL